MVAPAGPPPGRFLLGAVQLKRHADELELRQQAIEGMISYLVAQGWDRPQLAKLRSTRDRVAAAAEAIREAAEDLGGGPDLRSVVPAERR